MLSLLKGIGSEDRAEFFDVGHESLVVKRTLPTGHVIGWSRRKGRSMRIVFFRLAVERYFLFAIEVDVLTARRFVRRVFVSSVAGKTATTKHYRTVICREGKTFNKFNRIAKRKNQNVRN